MKLSGNAGRQPARSGLRRKRAEAAGARVDGGSGSLKEHALALIVYALAALAIIFPLLGPGYYLTLDMQFGPNSFSAFQFPELYGLAGSPYGAYLPLKMAFSALSAAVPVELIEKSLLFGILLLAGLSMHYSLPARLGASRYPAGLFYLLNPFVFARFIAGHWTLLLSYAIWPLAIKVFMDFLDEPQDRRSFALAAMATSAAAISSHGSALLLMAYAFIFIFRSIRFRPSRRLILGAASLGACVLAMNLFWLVPTFLQFGSSYSPAPASSYLQDFGANGMGMPLPLALLSLHGFWRGGILYTKDVFSLWYVPFAAILAIAAAGFLSMLKPAGPEASWREGPYFACALIALSIVAFLLAMGASSPAYPLISALGSGFPLYFVFRDTQKFIALLPMAYSVFAAYGMDRISSGLGKAAPFALALALAAVLLQNYGFFGFLGQIRPTEYPPDWAEADRIIAADPVQGNVLVLPSHLYYQYDWVDNFQKTVGNPAAQFFSKPTLAPASIESGAVQSDVNDPSERYVAFIFHNRQYINNTAQLLLPIGVRYAIVLKSDQDADNYLWLFKRRGGVPNITLAYESPGIYLFRNELARGPLMASDENGSGDFSAILDDSREGMYSGDVTYTSPNPATYIVQGSGKPYIVISPQSRFLDYSGSAPGSWHGLASYYRFETPGAITNRLFLLTSALLALSWAVAMWLALRPSGARQAALALGAILLSAAVVSGALGPAAIGWILILSALGCAVSPLAHKPSLDSA